MPKVTTEHRDARRAEITDAAIRSFAAKGFQRTSMADIIAEAGLSAGAIYGHFGGKKEIALAVAHRVLDARTAEIEEATESDAVPSPGAAMDSILGGLSTDLLGSRLLVQLWGEATTEPELSEQVQAVFARLRGVWSRYLVAWALSGGTLTRAEAEEWARHRVSQMLALAQGYILQSELLVDFDRSEYLAGVDALLPRP